MRYLSCTSDGSVVLNRINSGRVGNAFSLSGKSVLDLNTFFTLDICEDDPVVQMMYMSPLYCLELVE